MNLEKLNPWNWFKHEEGAEKTNSIPVTRDQAPGIAGDLSAGSPLLGLHREMDRLFDDAFRSFGMPSLRQGIPGLYSSDSSMSQFFRPQIDVSGDESRYEIALDVPDMSESDISIDVHGDVLTIKGHKEQREENKDKQYYRVERSYGSFQRTLSLPDDANADEIKAELKKGVLRLEIPRRQLAEKDVKRIPISS